jgi:hypothetical protein
MLFRKWYTPPSNHYRTNVLFVKGINSFPIFPVRVIYLANHALALGERLFRKPEEKLSSRKNRGTFGSTATFGLHLRK